MAGSPGYYYPDGNGIVWDYDARREREIGRSEGLQSGYSWAAGPGSYAVGWDAQRPGGAARQVYYTPQPAPAAPPPADPKPPVIEAKPAPAFDATTYSKPTATTPERPRYELNTRASGYEEWLARNRPGGGSSDGSQSDTPSTGGGGGGDRVRFYQDKLASGEPGAASAGHYGESSAGNGGERRMAGSRQFKERLNRYRS